MADSLSPAPIQKVIFSDLNGVKVAVAVRKTSSPVGAVVGGRGQVSGARSHEIASSAPAALPRNDTARNPPYHEKQRNAY